MKKLLLFLLPALLVLGSCNRKQMLLTRASHTVLEGVDDHSYIYIEYDEDTKGAYLNETNRIAGTNYLFAIERELNLLDVAKMVKKVKDHKYDQENMHSDEKGVFYIYVDSLHKNRAWFPFKDINFAFTGPTALENVVYVEGANDFIFEGNKMNREELMTSIQQRDSIQLGFNKELSFETYLQVRVLLEEKEISAKFQQSDLVY
ncbi:MULTISPECIES: hypothetical protein [Myroides]|uniref:Lipoprotein n=1 Tax=Myroides albus TaxID=2562892 RepID=A0A6I3LH69_9FLAO|nr:MULTISPECIES: hypothetical protein [Myroides]MTG97848.1 hypothetical protein [Myroides albus]MVX35970.1 hypothetical protein [Myroides sp. LoEW2-1]UVD79805.1 hypothetical protein NWE55_00485 [Myroides albus]